MARATSPRATLPSLTLQAIRTLGDVGLLFLAAFKLILQGRISWLAVLEEIEKRGIGSLPIVTLSASFIGMAISVQFAREIVDKYGAENMVGGFVAITMIRELGPIFVAVVMAGNIGAAMTAEIASMKVTEQIDALKVFKINPIQYLVVPRLISTAVVGPCLTLIGTYLGMLSGQLFTEYLVNIPAGVFWDSAQYNIQTLDIVNLLTKAIVFASTITVIASYSGFCSASSSEAVGAQTTKTVVYSLLAIFILNYILTSLFFQS